MKMKNKLFFLLVLVASLAALLYVQNNTNASAEVSETSQEVIEEPESPQYENRTIRAMVENAKTDPDLLDSLADLPDDAPIIEYKGGFFSSSSETKEEFYAEILTPDEQGVQWRDDDAATVGEVREAILKSQGQQ